MALNKTGVIKETAVTPKSILIAPEMAISFSALISRGSTPADSSGKIIIKAGTPLSGSFEARNTGFQKATTSNAVGILLHDVDVTDNKYANGSVVAFGVINMNALDSETAALITDEVKSALPRIIFVK